MNNYKIVGRRNPQIILESEDGTLYIIQTIGDPHLGRNFRNNQRHRLGDREKSIKETFLSLLHTPCNEVVIMGDLLDKVVISNEWLDFVITSLKEASLKFPYKTFVILNGNHDEVKDKGRISSFSLVEQYFDSYKGTNICFVSDDVLQVQMNEYKVNLCYTNYNSFKNLDELLPSSSLRLKEGYTNIAFGHFEVESFGSDKFIDRELPKVLLQNFNLIVTGHIHTPSQVVVDGVDILITGSMQPYSFGEQITEDNNLYIDIDISELKKLLDNDSEMFSNSNVRIFYEKDDELLPPFNAYSISYKLKNKVNTFQDVSVLTTDVLSFSSLFLEVLKNNTNELNTEYASKIEQIFLEKNYESN